MLQAEQLAFNAGMLRVGALLTGMEWVIVSGTLAWLEGQMARLLGQAAYWFVLLPE